MQKTFELIYQDQTIGMYNNESEAIDEIKNRENITRFIRKEKNKI